MLNAAEDMGGREKGGGAVSPPPPMGKGRALAGPEKKCEGVSEKCVL